MQEEIPVFATNANTSRTHVALMAQQTLRHVMTDQLCQPIPVLGLSSESWKRPKAVFSTIKKHYRYAGRINKPPLCCLTQTVHYTCIWKLVYTVWSLQHSYLCLRIYLKRSATYDSTSQHTKILDGMGLTWSPDVCWPHIVSLYWALTTTVSGCRNVAVRHW